MSSTLVYSGILVIRRCWCGIQHAIPADLSRTADRNPRQTVFCPLGHSWVSAVHEENKIEALRLEVANREEDLRAEHASHVATKGHLTRARKRAAAGLCPCCNRSFVDLARHVATQHPEFQP